jgi:hypothetical protein
VLAEIDRADDAPILGEIIGVLLDDSPLRPCWMRSSRQRRLFETIVALIRHRAVLQPQLWIVDDAH